VAIRQPTLRKILLMAHVGKRCWKIDGSGRRILDAGPVKSAVMFRNVIINSCARALDRIDSWITLSRLGWCDWLAGPMPETAADQAIREQAELLRAGHVR